VTLTPVDAEMIRMASYSFPTSQFTRPSVIDSCIGPHRHVNMDAPAGYETTLRLFFKTVNKCEQGEKRWVDTVADSDEV
jgi:hypothetical protein